MRILLAFIFLFSLVEINGQTVKLNTLINGKVIHSSTIVDSNEDIFGYFYLYDHGKSDKNIFSYRYVVLDKNLNLVTEGEFQEMKYSNFILGTLDLSIQVKYFKDKIWIRIFETDGSYDTYFERFRFIDLKTNELSRNYQFRNDSLLINKEIPRKISTIYTNRRIIPAYGIGFYNDVNVNIYDYKSYLKIDDENKRKILMFDDQFKLKWEYPLVKNGQINLEKIYSDSTILLLVATNYDSKSYKSVNHSIKALDAQTGLEKFEVGFSGRDKSFKIIKNAKVQNGKLFIFGLYGSKLLNVGLDVDETQGMFKTEIDIKTGEILSENSLSWKELGTYFSIPVYTNGTTISGSRCPFIHEFVTLKDGQSVCVIEYYQENTTKIRDIVFLKLDENLKPQFHERVDKENRIKIKSNGVGIKNYGEFDYYFSQALSTEDEFLFFFITNKTGTSFFSKKNEYNILAYLDGQFQHQKIELKTGESQVYPMPAKKGYMLLLEVFKEENKSSELRLEKINL
jgi:hypothetical protein